MKVLPTSKALKLYTTLSSTPTTDCFASMFERKLDRCMMNCDDRFETFYWNINKLTLNVKCEKFMHLRQMTLHGMLKEKTMNPNFCHKNCALTRDACLNRCVLKREISTVWIELFTLKYCQELMEPDIKISYILQITTNLEVEWWPTQHSKNTNDNKQRSDSCSCFEIGLAIIILECTVS